MQAKKNNAPAIANDLIMSRIYYIRDQKVMLDRDLATLYAVQTKVLKQAG